ncbi:MAG: PspA/IM30 family protein [Chloroflexi bacterium]|nr:PspA/IM30 family protein [Chloroflexota bacterium]
MGILSRMTTIIKSKISRLLDRAEDPRETLDYSYEKQLELLRQVKRGVVEVVSSKARLQLQMAKVQESISKLDNQARQSLAAGRDDLAKMALERKQVALSQLSGLDAQIAGLEKEQQRLTEAEQRLSAKVETFRTQKEVIKAQYTAAEAQVRIGEALSGISEEMTDVGVAIERAEQRTESMKARATAIDQLVNSGVLEDVTAKGDLIDRELAKITSSQNVQKELETMKRELAAPETKQLEAGR